MYFNRRCIMKISNVQEMREMDQRAIDDYGIP